MKTALGRPAANLPRTIVWTVHGVLAGASGVPVVLGGEPEPRHFRARASPQPAATARGARAPRDAFHQEQQPLAQQLHGQHRQRRFEGERVVRKTRRASMEPCRRPMLSESGLRKLEGCWSFMLLLETRLCFDSWGCAGIGCESHAASRWVVTPELESGHGKYLLSPSVNVDQEHGIALGAHFSTLGCTPRIDMVSANNSHITTNDFQLVRCQAQHDVAFLCAAVCECCEFFCFLSSGSARGLGEHAAGRTTRTEGWQIRWFGAAWTCWRAAAVFATWSFSAVGWSKDMYWPYVFTGNFTCRIARFLHTCSNS